MSRDDVVLQRPEDIRLLLSVFHTPNACCGAATAYLLRRIAYRAGAYAPGIHEHIFHELNTSREGGTIDKVQRWFGSRVSKLHELGYRLQCRHVATPTSSVLDWVRAGRGYRGAMVPTAFKLLHPEVGTGGNMRQEATPHAVGVTVDRLEAKGDEQLVMVDPWPGGVDGMPDRTKISDKLEPAHKARNYHALIFYWVGWS